MMADDIYHGILTLFGTSRAWSAVIEFIRYQAQQDEISTLPIFMRTHAGVMIFDG